MTFRADDVKNLDCKKLKACYYYLLPNTPLGYHLNFTNEFHKWPFYPSCNITER